MSWLTEADLRECILPNGMVRYPSVLAQLVLINELYFDRWYINPRPPELDVPPAHVEKIIEAVKKSSEQMKMANAK